MNKTGTIVLAAGNSSRLGKPKQLLSYHGKSLLQHVCSEALKANLYPLAVVTGAYAKDVSATLAGGHLTIVCNENWQQGMASGIAAGLSKILLLKNDIENIIICVCDQPYVSAQLFGEIIAKKADIERHCCLHLCWNYWHACIIRKSLF